MNHYLNPIAFLLTIVGGINWLTFALFDLNLVNFILGSIPMLEKAVYIIVGFSAIYCISLFKIICTSCNK